jgi:hypothetical protein
MPVEGLVKLRSCTVVSEALARAHVAGQFATEVIVKGPLRQASKEFPLQCSKSISASQPPNGPLHFLRAGSK